MSTGAIYFPSIDVPNSSWFSRTLLYWGEIASIVPYEYAVNPDKLDRHTQSLVQAGLVKQVFPDQYLNVIPDHQQAFIDYLEQLGIAVIQRRRERFNKTVRYHVHLSKLGYDLKEYLVGLEVAEKKGSQWIEMESTTALEYMAYLAAALGKIPSLNLTPLTNYKANLSVFRSKAEQLDVDLDPIRYELLKEAFPAPAANVTAKDLAYFRDRHGNELPNFRNWVEQKITAVVACNDQSLRDKMLLETKEEIRLRTEEYKAYMNKFGWPDVIFGDLCAIASGANIPGAGLVNAVYSAIRKKPPVVATPLAYAAYAQDELDLAKNC